MSIICRFETTINDNACRHVWSHKENLKRNTQFLSSYMHYEYVLLKLIPHIIFKFHDIFGYSLKIGDVQS